jgi:hypothetical protein
MATNERESNNRFDTYLGNGDPLHHKSVHVPRNRGPFQTWEAGAVDALVYDHIAGIDDWSWTRACYEWETWNGFGYRAHGLHSAYLWAGTSIYTRGRYAGDGNFHPHEQDTQLGTVAIAAALIKLDPSLQFPGGFPENAAPLPQAAPAGLGGGQHGMSWLQDALNHATGAGLRVDGMFGRMTRMAVKAFQEAHGLPVTGLSDQATIAALEQALKLPPQSAQPPLTATVPLFGGAQALFSAEPEEPVHEVPLYPVYDHDCAMWCVGLYNYSGQPSVNWDHVDAGEDDDVCWAVKRVGEVDIVVLRGSATLEDWIRDADAMAITPATHPVLGSVHAGFYAGMEKVCEEVLARNPKNLIITGHSLGGARATILTALLKANGKPPLARVTFGEPRPGFAELADYLEDVPGRAYCNGNDYVTKLPFSITGMFPYVHPTPLIAVAAAPAPGDPWGPFAPHHSQLYAEALKTINTGTMP